MSEVLGAEGRWFHYGLTSSDVIDTAQAVHDQASAQLEAGRAQGQALASAIKASEAQLKVTELGPKRLRFKLVLRQSDVALLIGRNGFSASAIRGVLKSITEREDVNVSLQIHSTEEENEMLARERH